MITPSLSSISQKHLSTESTPQRKRSWFLDFLREGHHQAWNDIRIKYRRFLFSTGIGVYFLSLPVCLGLCIGYFVTPSDETNACTPDGALRLDPGKYRKWSSSGFFQITYGFGKLNFTQAKTIDIAWDIVSLQHYTTYSTHCASTMQN